MIFFYCNNHINYYCINLNQVTMNLANITATITAAAKAKIAAIDAYEAYHDANNACIQAIADGFETNKNVVNIYAVMKKVLEVAKKAENIKIEAMDATNQAETLIVTEKTASLVDEVKKIVIKTREATMKVVLLNDNMMTYFQDFCAREKAANI